MQSTLPRSLRRLAFAGALIALAGAGRAPAQTNSTTDFRGLWVGQVTLNYATEVTVGLDKNNNPVAPDPQVPTPTADQANLRLILHVNGAGQVTLLRDVAVLNRVAPSNFVNTPVNILKNPGVLLTNLSGGAKDSDVSLITDERLYPEFPVQAAIRVASAVFDFGDSQATDAVDSILNAAAAAAASNVNAIVGSIGTNRPNVTAAASNAAFVAASPLLPKADVAAAFAAFLATHFKSATVDAVAGAANPVTAAAAARTEALKLKTNSFYLDPRAVEMVDAVVAAVQAATLAGSDRTNAAQNTAASYADVTNNYHRFIAGKQFGDMMVAAAKAAAAAAIGPGANFIAVSNAVSGDATVNAARAEALRVSVAAYRDTRATEAIERVAGAIVANVVAALPPTVTEDTLRTAAEDAGRAELANHVARYPVPVATPTPDYNTFVLSAEFLGSAAVAANAAAEAAISERINNALYTQQSLLEAAKLGALTALQGVYGSAARAVRTELPLEGIGNFGPGHGDPRYTYEIKRTNGPALSPSGAISGTVILPANHPTNPFRHRRHPDHTRGFDITRKLRLDFDGLLGSPLERSGYGVDRVTGVYREEVFGLHKPLGPDQDTGLRVEGRFELNRVSRIDTLNAR